MARTLLVVNPASRAGATERGFSAIEASLREALGSYDLAWTKGPRDAVRIAREAATAGYARLLVGGGATLEVLVEPMLCVLWGITFTGFVLFLWPLACLTHVILEWLDTR